MVNLVPIGWKNGQPQRLSAGEKISSDFLELPESGASENVLRTFTQSSHGFSVGSQIRPTSSGWVAAQGNTIANATNVWTVIAVDGDDVTACKIGRVEVPSHGLGSNNTLLHLSPTSAGGLTSTKPVGTLVDHLGFYLPVIWIEDANTIHVLGKSYPCLTNILGRRVLTSTTSSVAFQNVNFSKGAKLRISGALTSNGVLALSIANGTLDINKCDNRRVYNYFSNDNMLQLISMDEHPLIISFNTNNLSLCANLSKDPLETSGSNFFISGKLLNSAFEAAFNFKFGFSATPPSLINFDITSSQLFAVGSTFELLQEIE